MITRMGAHPRMLADDLMVLTFGIHHCANMKTAVDATHVFLQDMGATVAPNKSYLFSNVSSARRLYSQHTWKHVGAKIPMVRHTRDLGGNAEHDLQESFKGH